MSTVDRVAGGQRTGIELGGHRVVVVTPPTIDPMVAIDLLTFAVNQHGPEILTSAHYPRDPDGTPKRVELLGYEDRIIAAVELA